MHNITEKESTQRDLEAERRIAMLRMELAAVQAEREALWQGMMDNMEKRLEPEPERGGTVKRIGLLVVAIGNVLLLYQILSSATEGQPIKARSAAMSISAETPIRVSSSTTLRPPEQEAQRQIPAPQSEQKTKAAGSRRAKISKKKPNAKKRPKKKTRQPKERNILENFAACGDDPLCASLDKKQ